MGKNRRFHISILLAVLVMAAFAAAQQGSQDKVAVYVVARDTAADGGGPIHMSKGRRKYAKQMQASVEDIRNKLKDSKVVRLVEAEPDATVVLEVIERGVEDGAVSEGSELHVAHLTAQATAGKYTAEFQGETDLRNKWQVGGYSEAARKVARQLEDWISANHAALVALKK